MNYAKYSICHAVALVLTSGCETHYPHCEESVTVLESLDTPTPAGVSAGEILALIEGQRSAELRYAEPGGGSVHVEIEPGGEGSTALSLALSRRADGELRWIDAHEVYPTGPGPVAEIAVYCPDRLEIDAQLEFETADGVFAELFEVVVGVDMDDELGGIGGELGVARIHERFDPAGLMGALEVISIDPPNPDAVDYELEIHYPVAEWAVAEGGELGQPRGMVGGGAQYTSGKGNNATVSYGTFRIGTFGDWNLD
jgi:hypothetical protein